MKKLFFLIIVALSTSISLLVQAQEQTLMLRDYISGVDASGNEIYRCNYTYNDYGYLTSQKTYRRYSTSQPLSLQTSVSESYFEEYDFDEKNRPTRHSKYLCDADGNKGGEIERILATYGGEFSHCKYVWSSYQYSNPILKLLYEYGYDQWNNQCHYISYSSGQIQTKQEERFIGPVKTTDKWSSDYDEETVTKNRYYYVKATGSGYNGQNYTSYVIEGKKKENPTDADYSYYINTTVSPSMIDDFTKLDDLWVKYEANASFASAPHRAREQYSDDDWYYDINTETDSEGHILIGTMYKIWRDHMNGYRIYTPENEYKDPIGVLPLPVSIMSPDYPQYYKENYMWQQGEWVLTQAYGTKIYYKENGCIVAERYEVENGKPYLFDKRLYYYDSLKRLVKIQSEEQIFNEYTYVDDTNLVKTVKDLYRTDTYYYISHKYVNPVTLSVCHLLSDKKDMTTRWFTLDGRSLSNKPNQKGLYIYRGRKVVVK